MATALCLLLTCALPALAAYTDEELAAFGNGGYTDNEIRNGAVSQSIAAQSYVLLENNGVLPLKAGAVALFGNAATATVKGGTGSGIVNQRERDWIDTALEDAGFTVTTPAAYREAVGRGVVATGFVGGYLPPDVEITDEWLSEALAADTAIYAVARNAGEGKDRTAEPGDYYLTDIERANIEKIAAAFETVVIILNTMIMDVSWVREIGNIGAVLYMGYGGQSSGAALAQVLTGEIAPSGKVSSTWAWDISDYASTAAGFSLLDGDTATEYYSDGIYVGYRYFDTFGVDVAYPFGYGLSYTDFDISVEGVTADADVVTVTATVTNTGTEYAGREVVQVYFSAPDGVLDKPYQELAAYAKTDELAPGASQTLTLSYPTSDMSSYSEALASYVMEAGEYIIRAGNCSRNTHVAAAVVLTEDMITEQLENRLPLEDGAVLDELSGRGASPITYPGEAEEIAAAERIALDTVHGPVHNAPENDGDTVTTYLFAADAADYAPGTYTVRTKSVRGVLQNNTGSGGYQTASYREAVEVVPDLPAGITKENAKLTDVVAGRITLEQFAACLSADELARLVNGDKTSAVGYICDGDGNTVAFSHAMPGNVGRTTTALFESRHIPVLSHSDGPAGLRCDQDGVVSPQITADNPVGGTYFESTDGVTISSGEPSGESSAEAKSGPEAVRYSIYPTAFPAGANIADTWDVGLAWAYGEAVGAEMAEYGVAAWLAPGMNIVRNPLGGRSFEYYSEDPLLTGVTAAYVTAGVQSHPGVGVTLKHFYANSQENNRNAVNNVISERAAREIYLKGYEIAVRQAQPMYLMSCYNENNGWPGGDHRGALTDILRGEWGFRGYVMTDWGGGQSSPYISMHAGNDMIMSGGDPSAITEKIGVHAPEFEEDGSVHEEQYQSFFGTVTTESWGTFVADPSGSENAPAPVAGYDALSEDVLWAIEDGLAEFAETEDGTFVLWHGYNSCICLGDLQQSALRILNVMLYSRDMHILCDDLDEAFSLGLHYGDTPYAAAWSAAMDAPLAGTDPRW